MVAAGCTMISAPAQRQQYQEFVPHGKVVGRDPFNKWVKPSCVMICENDYSNGHGFHGFTRNSESARLIGAPAAGTMTAVWWETLMDNTLVFGIPSGRLPRHAWRVRREHPAEPRHRGLQQSGRFHQWPMIPARKSRKGNDEEINRTLQGPEANRFCPFAGIVFVSDNIIY